MSEWEPLWEAANDLQIPLTMHVGGTRMPPSTRGIHPGQADISWYNLCCGMGETLGWLVYSGVFDRYPDLHAVMTEGYAGWLPFAIQFFDHHWNGSRLHYLGYGQGGDAPKIDAPTERVPEAAGARHLHVGSGGHPCAADVTGVDCLLWGNDYPHLEGSFPESEEWVDKQFSGVPESEIDAMVRVRGEAVSHRRVRKETTMSGAVESRLISHVGMVVDDIDACMVVLHRRHGLHADVPGEDGYRPRVGRRGPRRHDDRVHLRRTREPLPGGTGARRRRENARGYHRHPRIDKALAVLERLGVVVDDGPREVGNATIAFALDPEQRPVELIEFSGGEGRAMDFLRNP